MKCVICSRKITTDLNGWDGGHNAEPIVEGKHSRKRQRELSKAILKIPLKKDS